MTRRVCRLVLLCAVVLCLAAGADAAMIVGLSGDVKVKAPPAASWQAAQKGQVLSKESQIKCGPEARCTVALDALLRNTVTVKEGSTVILEDLTPGRVFLKEGRVFSVIKDLKGAKSFEVRTPTSVSSARGTAWLTDFRTGRTEVSVFEDNVFVNGLDAAGVVTDAVDVATGQGVSVAADGFLGEIFVIPVELINEWLEEKQGLQDLRKEHHVPPLPDIREQGKKVVGVLVKPAEPPPEPKKETSADNVFGTGPPPPSGDVASPLAGHEPHDGVAPPPPPPMTEEEKLLYEMQKARMEMQQALDGTMPPPPGSEPALPYDPVLMPPLIPQGGMLQRSRAGGFFEGEAPELGGDDLMMDPGATTDPDAMDPDAIIDPDAMMDPDPMMDPDTMFDEPMMEELMMDEPMSDEPMFDEPMMDEPISDESMMDEPMFDEPMFDEPISDESMMDEPMFDEPMFDEPMMDEPMFDDPMMDPEFQEDIHDPDVTHPSPPPDDGSGGPPPPP